MGGIAACLKNPDVLETVLRRLANGEILNAIAADIGFDQADVWHLAQMDENFARLYASARQTQAHAIAADVVYIADSEPDVQRARIRADARRWYAAKLDPRTYGDKQTVDHQHSGTVTLSLEERQAHSQQVLERAFGKPSDGNSGNNAGSEKEPRTEMPIATGARSQHLTIIEAEAVDITPPTDPDDGYNDG